MDMDNSVLFINNSYEKLELCNQKISRYGLSLKSSEINMLLQNRLAALKNAGRVEFGVGITEKLIDAFCDSPYVCKSNFAETISEIQDLFYLRKSSIEINASDNELIEILKELFNGYCAGSTVLLSDVSDDEIVLLLCGRNPFAQEQDGESDG